MQVSLPAKPERLLYGGDCTTALSLCAAVCLMSDHELPLCKPLLLLESRESYVCLVRQAS